MYGLVLCQARLDVELVVRSPTHVGGDGASDQVQGYRRRPSTRTKARGSETIELRRNGAKRPGESELALPIHRLGDGEFDLFVPASSFRGAVRHFLWKRLRRARRDQVTDARWAIDRPADRDDREDGADPTTAAYWEPRFGGVLMRHLFGSEARRGALRFSSLEPSHHRDQPAIPYSDREEVLFRRPRPTSPMRTLVRNRLDRFTMESTEGLRNFAAMEAGTTLTGNIQLDSFSWWQLGALGLALRGMQDGSIRLGRRGGTGLGRVDCRPTRLVLRWHRRVAPLEGRELLDTDGCLALLGREDADRHRGVFGDRRMFVPTMSERVPDVGDIQLAPAGPAGQWRQAEWTQSADGDPSIMNLLLGMTATLADTARSLSGGPHA
ncbi:MAG: hypothetical protein D6798_05860 [Deltaproteobacteria bacterium]|nr:MAG: hypothetical protein D6798_05860 [Deltaproteobacteria bacterium]